MTSLRVVVVDDQTLVREGFALLLAREDGLEVVGLAANGLEALRLVAVTRPDVALVDLRMPGLDGAETVARIVRANPDVAVLVLTTYLHDAAVLAALRAGPLGAIGKDATAGEVAAAIRSVHAGAPVLPSSAQRALLTGAPAPQGAGALSGRQVEVLRLVSEGLRNAEIARRLGISLPTVKTHVNNVFSKLGVTDRAAAVAAAVASRLLG